MFWINMRRITIMAVRNIMRNTFLTLATLLVVVLTMFSITVMLITNLVTDTALSAINKQVDILVEIQESAEKKDVDSFIADLEAQNVVNKVVYMSKEEVFANFSQTFLNIKDFWDKNNLTNPLPAMLKIEIVDPSVRQAVIDFISSRQYDAIINKDFFAGDIESYKAKQIIKITEATKKFILSLTGLFFMLSILIIFNTIRINIFARKDELQIMDLIGAKYYYMRVPFIVEGALYGVGGAILTSIFMIFVLLLISPTISQYLSGYEVGFEYSFYKYLFIVPESSIIRFYFANFLSFVGLLSMNGLLIGSISAAIATYKYEKL